MPIPDIQTFFRYGLDRDIPQLVQPPRQVVASHEEASPTFGAGFPRLMHGETIVDEWKDYPSVELGPGKRKQIPTTYKLGLPDWDARYGAVWTEDGTEHRRSYPGALPYEDETIGEIHAYQFMEHLDGKTAVALLRDMQRVLVPGGVVNLVMPYYNSAHMAQALDHKSFWSEETWHWLFGNEYYDDHEFNWQLRVHCCFIMGIVERNLDLFTQLVKVGP